MKETTSGAVAVGRPSVDDLLRLTRGGRHCVTIYQPLLPAPSWDPGQLGFRQELGDSLAIAMNRLGGRGAGHDTRSAIRGQVEPFLQQKRYGGLSAALFLTDESASCFLLPDRTEAGVRVGDYFDLGPMLRAVTMSHPVFGVTISEHTWELWGITGAKPATMLLARNRNAAAQGHPWAWLFDLYRHVTGSVGYLLSRGDHVAHAMKEIRTKLAEVDPERDGLVVLFPDDDAFSGWRSTVAENARLDRPIEIVEGDSEALTPGRIGRELRRHRTRFVRAELSHRIGRLRAEHSDGYPSTNLAEIAVAAANGRVHTLIYDVTDVRYGHLDAHGRFTSDQWGYDVLARVAIDVLASGGEAFAVTPDELRTGTMDSPVLAEIAYPSGG